MLRQMTVHPLPVSVAAPLARGAAPRWRGTARSARHPQGLTAFLAPAR